MIYKFTFRCIYADFIAMYSQKTLWNAQEGARMKVTHLNVSSADCQSVNIPFSRICSSEKST